jgi:hypothetical protein
MLLHLTELSSIMATNRNDKYFNSVVSSGNSSTLCNIVNEKA